MFLKFQMTVEIFLLLKDHEVVTACSNYVQCADFVSKPCHEAFIRQSGSLHSIGKRLLAHFVAFRKRYRQSVKNITYSST